VKSRIHFHHSVFTDQFIHDYPVIKIYQTYHIRHEGGQHRKLLLFSQPLKGRNPMAQLYKTTGEILEIRPKHGKQFFLSDVQDLMGQGVIWTLRIDENLRMLYFKDALPSRMAFNGNASVKAHMAGALSEDLHGNIVFADVAELFWGEQFETRRWDRR
jgi:hypothetical protein